MANNIDEAIRALHTTTSPRDYPARLCVVSRDTSIDQRTFTCAVLQATRVGSLPADALAFWASITRDTASIIQCMQQNDSPEACKAAISNLTRMLRNDKVFDATWEDIGGTAGLVSLLNTLSVQHVYYLCRKLVKNPRTVLRQKRQQACKDLLEMLCPKNAEVANKRPLQDAYHILVVACDADTALAWDDHINLCLRKRLRGIHGDAFLKKTLDACFPPSATTKVDHADFVCLQALIQHNPLRYGLATLTRLTESKSIPLGLKTNKLFDKLIRPLVSRELRENGRRIGREASALLWKMVTACFKKHPVFRTYLRGLKKNPWDIPSISVILQIVHDWGRFDGDADHNVSLTILLQLMDKYNVQPSTNVLPNNRIQPSTDILVRCVPPRLRYRLLRLFFQYANGFGVDMGALGETQIALSEAQRLRFTLPTFFLLPPNEARLLAQCLLTSDPDLEWLANEQCNIGNCRNQLLGLQRSPSDSRPDPYTRQAMLQSITGAKGGLSLADELLRRKKIAQTSHVVDGRSFWATSAIWLSIAMGDLETYEATLNWSKRFARDWQVCHDLFSYDIVHAPEGVDLLCVVPPKSLLAFACFDKSAFAAAMNKANQILELYIQQALDATREPAFQDQNCCTVFVLMNEVMFRRLEHVNAWQDRFGISDTHVTELLWTPTLDALINVERQLLDFMNAELCHIARSTLYKRSRPSLGHLRAPALLFIDGLARARDGLWEAYRTRLDPHVASLSAPWPRGLPLNETVIFPADAPFTLPYMEERAKAIVFGDIDLYLCPVDDIDKDTKKAIGNFVESWPKALHIYVCGARDEERKIRIRSVWDYVKGSLSTKLGLSKSQIRCFWKPYFAKFGANIPKSDDDKIMILPSVDFPLSSPTSAWNPMNAPSLPAPVKDCRIESVCLGAVLGVCSLDNVQVKIIHGISGPRLYWDLATSQKNLPQQVVDSYICTAGLVLNTLYGSEPLLDEPFPSNDPVTVRFPAMNLDPGFAGDTANGRLAESVLHTFVRQCPTAFLTRLASSLLNNTLKLLDTKTAYQTNMCLQYFCSIFRMVRKKAPVAARDLAGKAILGLMRESSFHRVFLSNGLLQRLPSSETEKTMNNLLEEIQRRLDTVEVAKKDENEKENSRKQVTPVKISTIKMVAQLLRNTAAVSPEYAVDILTRLFRVSTHIDVHRKAVQSLARVAQSLPDNAAAMQQQIIQAFTTYALPRIGSLDERQCQDELTENYWQSVDAGQTPLQEIVRGENRVLLQALINACRETRPVNDPDHPKLHAALLRLLKEALCENCRLHRRWLRSFIIRENLVVWSQEIDSLLPAVPAPLGNFLENVFNETGLVTLDLFQAMSQHILHRIEPPAALAAITARIDADPQLSRSTGGSHWLHMWKSQEGGTIFWPLGGSWATYTLVSPSSTPDTLLGGDADMLANFVQDMAFAFLRVGDINIIDGLASILIEGERKAWDANAPSPHRGRGKGLVLLHQLASEIDQMRSRLSWRQNPDRKPAILPASFTWKYKIWQCGVPYRGAEVLNQRDVLSDVVDSTVKLVKELVEDLNTPYHLGIKTLKDWFSAEGQASKSFHDTFLMSLAIALGSVDVTADGAHGNVVSWLCADLSSSYLEGYKQGGNARDTQKAWNTIGTRNQWNAVGTEDQWRTADTGNEWNTEITESMEDAESIGGLGDAGGSGNAGGPWGEGTPQVEAMVEAWKRSSAEFLWSKAHELMKR